MEVSTEKSKIMTNSMNKISADISTNGQKLEEVTNFKRLGAAWCKDGTCSAEVHIRIGNGSNGRNDQTKQDLAVQHHQLCQQAQALRVSCHLHPPLWLSNMDPAC